MIVIGRLEAAGVTVLATYSSNKSKNVEAVDECHHPDDVCGDGKPQADEQPRTSNESNMMAPAIVETRSIRECSIARCAR
jgi:hypothetical protein